MADKEIGRILTLIGAVLGIIGAIIMIVGGLIGGTFAAASTFSKIPGMSLSLGSAILTLIILGIIQFIVSYGLFEMSKRVKKKDHMTTGIIIIVLSIILFFVGGGFFLGPVLAFVGGLITLL